MAYYLTQPTSVALPANGNFVDVSVRLHRDDSGVPDTLPLATNAEHRVALLSEFLVGTTGAFTEVGIAFDGTQWWDWTESAVDANDVPHTQDTRRTLWFISMLATGADAQTIFSATDYALGVVATGQPFIRVFGSDGIGNNISGTLGPYTAGQRLNLLFSTESDGGTGMRIKIAHKLAAGSPTLDTNLTRARPDYDLTRAAFSMFSGNTPGGGSSSNVDTTLFGAALYAGGTIPDISQQATWDAFVNSNGTLKSPALADALLGVSPLIDTRGNDVAAMQAGTHRGTLGAAAVTGTFA